MGGFWRMFVKGWSILQLLLIVSNSNFGIENIPFFILFSNLSTLISNSLNTFSMYSCASLLADWNGPVFMSYSISIFLLIRSLMMSLISSFSSTIFCLFLAAILDKIELLLIVWDWLETISVGLNSLLDCKILGFWILFWNGNLDLSFSLLPIFKISLILALVVLTRINLSEMPCFS